MGPRTDEALPRSIQLLHLDQACVEDFIRDLVEVVPVRLEMTKE